MSSVTNTSAPLAPASTVVPGTVNPKRTDGDAFELERCVWFEKHLKLETHLRDKTNEERHDTDEAFVRINSKILHTSYQLSTSDIYGFLKRLYRTLVPGLRVKYRRKSTSMSVDCDGRDRRDSNVLYDWMTCSDFTAQVVPKYPTVLWFDLECMSCKSQARGEATGERHYRSRDVMGNVIAVVLENIGVHAWSDGKCDLMYITRGTTCGMHIFFPRVIVRTEYDGQEMWAAVNRRLSEKGPEAAMVDTGCSSMPLPLARQHNGMTRVTFERNDHSGEIKTRAFGVKVPNFQDLMFITNFSHLVSNQPTQSPPSSSFSSVRLTSGTAPSETHPATDTGIVTTKLDEDEPGPNAESISESREEKDATRRALEKKEEEEKNTGSTNTDDLGGDRSSSVSSSSSSRRLVQSDIRSICARVREKRKTRTTISGGESVGRKRMRTLESSIHGPIVIDDDEQEGPTVERRSDTGVEDVAESKVNSASSFLSDGYVPSIRYSDGVANSTVSSHRDTSRAGVKSTGNGVSVHCVDRPPTSTESISLTTAPGDCATPVPDSERFLALQVTDDSIPPNAHLPDLRFGVGRNGDVKRGTTNHLRDIAKAKETFARNMRLNLDGHENQTHETDIQLIVSGFNTEMDFYASMVSESTPLTCPNEEYDGLRIKRGCSLHVTRENCPNSLITEHVPFVLCSGDYVPEVEWVSVLVRYFDEYLNNAPFLYIMSHVLRRDENIKRRLNEASKALIERGVHNCLARFKMDMVRFQNKVANRSVVNEFNPPKHPYDEKCTVVIGVMAVCSTAYNIVTPLFTDLTKVCRLILGNTKQTVDLLNSSTMSSTLIVGSDRPYGPGGDADVEESFDESVSRPGDADPFTNGDFAETRGFKSTTERPRGDDNAAAHVGNARSVIASILRWNYPALGDQTLWGLFFYYYHVQADALARIEDEVVHGGLMVTALLQAYFETFANTARVDVRMVCSHVYSLHKKLQDEAGEKDRSLMPPPGSRGSKKRKTSGGGGAVDTRIPHETNESRELRRREFEARPEDAKKAQRKFRESKNGSTYDSGDEDDGDGRKRKRRTKDSGEREPEDGYLMSFDDVLLLIVQRYLRPVSFDETTVVFTESGYEQSQNEVVSYFANDKSAKRTVSDMFTRSILKYSMPHGDLLLYNTDVMGTVHRNSSCAMNLVLNIFENMYGGCMSYLTRRFNNNLKICNRFNADAYRLAVECRHAMNELVKLIERSYLNLLLRQPVVPPVLESDPTIRRMYISEEEIQRGTFVCLNVMDYVRSINMFTRNSKFSQENCDVVESFLDKLILDEDAPYGGVDRDACMRFRTVYLFFQLYVFEVLYKIRQTYSRDGSYRVSVDRLSWEMDVRHLLKLFFGQREFKVPRGLSPEALEQLDLPEDLYAERTDDTCGNEDEEDFAGREGEKRSTGTRCINTRPLVSAELPNKIARMAELFGRKGIVVMKSYAPIEVEDTGPPKAGDTRTVAVVTGTEERAESTCSGQSDTPGGTYEEKDRAFLDMTQAQLEDALYSPDKWYENCRIRVKAVHRESRKAAKSEKLLNGVDMCMETNSMDTFLRGQLRINIDNYRLRQIEKYVREKYDFAFCTQLPLRVKIIALVLATHSVKRLTTEVATEFIHKEYRLERAGVVRYTTATNDANGNTESNGDEKRPDKEWVQSWSRLLTKRKPLLIYCRSLADNHFPESYFIGLRPDNAYDELYNYMLGKSKYVTLQALRQQDWAKDMCVALNYLLVMNAYDPELVELCLRLFLGFEWPGQWAKRIFVWKSNSNAGKSYFFEHVIRKAFDQSTCINDPKGGKDNAPEKSEYYKNFVLMINEFSSASAGELKKLCSTSSYKFRMNFGNQMIQAFMVGKMVFNCNSLPHTTDHATIQRVALVPLPFWFQKRQTIVDSMLNWTRGQFPPSEYERNFRRNISSILVTGERNFFIENRNTKNEDDLFNRPNDVSPQLPNEFADQNTRASMFLVQNKTSQVYMMSSPPTGSIVSGIVSLTRYFCRFRFFNNIKEPVDYSVLPTACNNAAQEWQRISQPYFEWKERYQVRKDPTVRTKASTIYASINHFTKNRAKNISFFDLKQFFEWDFAEHKIPYYNAREDEYYVRIDQIQD